MTLTVDAKILDEVFGPGEGTSIEERAKSSRKLFVRGIDQLAEFSGKARGRQLTAKEALDAYGFEKLLEAVEDGSALLTVSKNALGQVLRDRREQLGLDLVKVASRARVDPLVAEAAEASKQVPIRECEKLARMLGLDERFLSVRSEPAGNESVAVRLRTIGREPGRMTPSAVMAIAEAAWVAMTQVRLEEELGIRPRPTGIQHNPNYATRNQPAFQWGYHLAREARRKLSVTSGAVPSMRALAEETLGIPIVQTELGETIAGVTVEVGERRAIVLNRSGKNGQVYVRRATMAHELAHLLYDPPQELNSLRVDDYAELDTFSEQLTDKVEQRANAFSAEFLVPQVQAVETFRKSGGSLRTVMDLFGVSFTMARYQVWNGLGRTKWDELTASTTAPPSEWEAQEAFTLDYHPIRDLRPSRAGRFSAVVVRAAEKKVISWDTAAEYLEATAEVVRAAVPQVQELYPRVFE